jgi:hypothetical protein
MTNNIIGKNHHKNCVLVLTGKNAPITSSPHCISTHAKNYESYYNQAVEIGNPTTGFSLDDIKGGVASCNNNSDKYVFIVLSHAHESTGQYALDIDGGEKTYISNFFGAITEATKNKDVDIEILLTSCYGHKATEGIKSLPIGAKLALLSKEDSETQNRDLCHEGLHAYLRNAPEIFIEDFAIEYLLSQIDYTKSPKIYQKKHNSIEEHQLSYNSCRHDSHQSLCEILLEVRQHVLPTQDRHFQYTVDLYWDMIIEPIKTWYATPEIYNDIRTFHGAECASVKDYFNQHGNPSTNLIGDTSEFMQNEGN